MNKATELRNQGRKNSTKSRSSRVEKVNQAVTPVTTPVNCTADTFNQFEEVIQYMREARKRQMGY